ncbi:hypothetical protein JVX90_03705 [Gordonia sp. PDNC005]|uniref:hypothetical protein n=1 Tax=unclassified Gordonia (in: high G+C Gram-positive bacteria) TaxID=2657482 RepID=UPI001963BFC1|nr:hypothetical protein [Gordonia sp. PDNC005]QRY63349.1 hypothetical protein JVX90_03705 [Gordonia sp. PDNC005]
MSTGIAAPSRMRGGVVGGASALTAIAAHGLAQGMLPSTDTLMIVAAAAVVIGAVVGAAPRLPTLPALLAGQGVVHILLVVLTGHHHDLWSPSMAVAHGVGTLVALALIATYDAVACAVRRVSTPVPFVAVPSRRVAPAPRSRTEAPAALLLFGSVGLRGPPLSLK